GDATQCVDAQAVGGCLRGFRQSLRQVSALHGLDHVTTSALVPLTASTLVTAVTLALLALIATTAATVTTAVGRRASPSGVVATPVRRVGSGGLPVLVTGGLFLLGGLAV